MDFDYNNLTEEDFEKYIEFIDFSKVPFEKIPDSIKKRFANYNAQLKTIIYLHENERGHLAWLIRK